MVSGSFIVLTVSDTGQGMDKATKQRIFEPYFTTKEVGKGTGMGLSIFHGIVKECHGFVRVRSGPTKGTSISGHIPALSHETPTTDKIELETPVPTGTERILLVDDEKIIANVSKTILERVGYEVLIATDSLDALKRLRGEHEQFDLLITDQTMPNLTGVELAEEVLKIKPNMPIILCTGYSSVLSEEDALAIGIKKNVRKPVARVTLIPVVRELLDELEHRRYTK